MQITKHCSERLPHGERLWRTAAQDAGFEGKLIIEGVGRRPWSRAELRNPRRKEFGVTYGLYDIRTESITILLGRAPCAVPDERAQRSDGFLNFLHELGHHRQKLRGLMHLFWPTGPETPLKEYRQDTMEMSADRYMRRKALEYLGRKVTHGRV